MVRTIIWYTHFAISLLATLPKLYKVRLLEKQGKKNEREKYIHKTISKWAAAQLKVSGVKVSVYGQENIPRDIPVVFMSNHQSNFDIPLFLVYVDKPKGFIAKMELKKIPILKNWMEHIHCVFMNRKDLRQSVKAIIQGIRTIKNGHSLVMFPEGTRSKGDEMGDFKAGSFKLATKPKVPIVPVTINGSYKVMEQNDNRIKPADVEIYIHPIVETVDLTKEEIEELPNKVKETIESRITK